LIKNSKYALSDKNIFISGIFGDNYPNFGVGYLKKNNFNISNLKL